MKSISIREKIAPYSYSPGTECLVPGSDWRIAAYPALLQIAGVDFSIAVTGPVEEFFVQMDLERDAVWVSGKAKEGYFRLKLSAIEEGLCITADRAPKEGIEIGGRCLAAKEKMLLATGGKLAPARPIERISFGNWKAQDWDLVRRRGDAKEIIPAAFLLGQKIPAAQEAKGGVANLLSQDLGLFFRAAFSGILAPQLEDRLHQGIAERGGSGDSLSLLPMAYRKIRSLLIEEEQERIRIAPFLEAGRAQLYASAIGPIDLEWTKGKIRRMIVHVERDWTGSFQFPKETGTFRFGAHKIENGEPISLAEGTQILFDRFQK